MEGFAALEAIAQMPWAMSKMLTFERARDSERENQTLVDFSSSVLSAS
jgi:hypothetical protein